MVEGEAEGLYKYLKKSVYEEVIILVDFFSMCNANKCNDKNIIFL